MVRLASVFLLSAILALAQKDTGAILGTVLDASGAAIPGAQVSATDTATNYTYNATTDSAGQY